MSTKKFTPKDRVLTPLNSIEQPSNLLFVKSETLPMQVADRPNQQLHHLRLWVCSAGRLEGGDMTRSKVVYSKSADEFWSFVDTRLDNKRPLWIFSHNLGFDFTVLRLWEKVLQHQYVFIERNEHSGIPGLRVGEIIWKGLAVIEDPPTILKFKNADTGQVIVAVDTLNYFACSLDDLGDAVCLPRSARPDDGCSDQLWMNHCSRDVGILERAIIALLNFVRQEKLCCWKMTGPSMAMACYRTKFLAGLPKVHIHCSPEIKQLERQCYYGGMVQQWYCGKVVPAEKWLGSMSAESGNVPTVPGPVYSLDINSAYPYAMRENLYPRKLLYAIDTPSAAWMQTALDTLIVAADVTLDCVAPGFPTRHKGKLVRAIGKFRTCLCGAELKRAWQEGSVRSVYRAALYAKADLFSSYVDYFWLKRREFSLSSNWPMESACKLFLNSLFGKFAQWRQRWEDNPDASAIVPFGHWWDDPEPEVSTGLWRSMGWLPQKQLLRDEHADSIPIISACVTAYAREYLLKLVAIAGVENCYYSDTDSIFCNEHGFKRLDAAGMIVPGELGKLKVKGKYESAEFRGGKNYTVGEQRVMAGVDNGCAVDSSGRYVVDKFSGIVSTIRSGILDGVAVTRHNLDYADNNPAGIILPDGSVRPLELP